MVPREEYWRVVPIEWFEMELFETVERIARIELRPVLEHRFTSHQSDVPQTIPLTALTRSTGAESNIGWIDNDNTEKHSSVYRRNGMLPGLLPEEYAKTRRMTHGPEGDEDWASACTSTSRASPFSSTSSTRRSRSTAGKSLPSSAAPTARSR